MHPHVRMFCPYLNGSAAGLQGKTVPRPEPSRQKNAPQPGRLCIQAAGLWFGGGVLWGSRWGAL